MSNLSLDSTVQPNASVNSGYRWKSLWASTTGYATEGWDLMVSTYVLIYIIKAFHLSTAQAGAISTVTLIGSVLGGYVFGVLADYFGRVRTFTYSILLFSVFTGLTAFVTNITWLDITRFIAGIGLGGEFGIGMTLVSEVWPKGRRALATSTVAIGFQFGMIIALVCSLVLVPHFGWRSAFLVGVLPALFAWWSRKNLKEPELWVQKTKDNTQGKRFPIGVLFDSPRRTATTIGLIIMTSVQNFGFYGVMTWLPLTLSKQLHMTFNKSLTWTFVTILGMIVGIMIFGYLSDRWGRKPSYLVYQLGAAILVWVFFHQSNVTLLLILGFVMGFFVDGMNGGYGAILAEHYPTEARSTAENFIYNTGRAVGGFGPFVIGTLALTHSLNWSMGFISGIYVIAALALIFLVPETKNKALV